jgi:hypothetical protein
MSRVYVFALTSRRASPFTCEGHRIEFIEVENLFAVIERRDAAVAISEGALRVQHTIVIRLFRRLEDLLPVRFGTWIDQRELADVVAARKTALVDALDLVRGRVQMTIRFSGSTRESRRRESRIDRRDSGTAYLEARRAAARDLPPGSVHISEAVRDLVVAERISLGSETLASALYHLIARVDVARYQATIEPFQSSLVSVSGPWPPFAFAPDPWP